jgi:hypothetical protein
MDGERVLRPSRLKWLLVLGISLTFVVGGLLALFWPGRAGAPQREGAWVMWLCVGFFGLGVVVCLLQFLPRSSFLRLDGEGFTIRTLYRERTYRWEDVDTFGVTVVSFNKMVGFNFAPHFDRAARLRRVNKAIAFFEGALPDTYGMKAEDLADLMNEYKCRHEAATGGRTP